MNKFKILTLSSVLTVLAASCDLSAAAENARLQLTARSCSSISQPLQRHRARRDDALPLLQENHRQ